MSVAESMRVEIPHDYTNESLADKQLKDIPATNENLFISRYSEKRFEEKFENREVVLGKPPKYNEVDEVENLPELFPVSECCPYLVRLFFSNLFIQENGDGCMIIRSYVKGKQIEFNSSKVNDWLGLTDDGYCVSKATDRRSQHQIDRVEMESCLFKGSKPSVNLMELPPRAVAFIVVQYVQCRQGKEMTDTDFVLTYKVMKREKINFGDVFCHNIDLTHRSSKRKLPYGQLLTRIFQLHDIHPENGEPIEVTKDFFGHRNLVNILGKRKKGESSSTIGDGGDGAVAEEQGNEGNDAEDSWDGRVFRENVEKKLENFGRRAKKIQDSLKKLKRRFKDFTRNQQENWDKLFGILGNQSRDHVQDQLPDENAGVPGVQKQEEEDLVATTSFFI